jgi:transposase
MDSLAQTLARFAALEVRLAAAEARATAAEARATAAEARATAAEARATAAETRAAAAEAKVVVLEARVSELEVENKRLREENIELRARLNKNSTNSNKPPSSDPPFKRPPPKTKGKRKPGGQPGHKGVTRAVIPPEQVDERKEIRPEVCACGESLQGVPGAGKPNVRQVVELPPIKPHVTEYLLQPVRCPCCHTLNAPTVPPEATTCTGPNLTALVATLVGEYHLSRDATAALLQTVLGIPICPATVQSCCEQMSQALVAPTREVEEAVPNAASIHLDETSWRQGGVMHWLWIGVTNHLALFAVNRRRGKDQLNLWFPKGYSGVLHCDRWRPYEMFGRRQLCWSHLERDIQAIIDRKSAGEQPAVDALAGAWSMFHTWHQFKEGKSTRPDLMRETAPYRAAFRRFCTRGRDQKRDRKWRALGKDLLRQWDAVFRFLDTEGVEPTNNTAEQGLRSAVIWRRTTQGTRTDAGSLFVSRVLTAVGTCRRQGRRVLDFMRDALLAHRRGTPPPSLLPPMLPEPGLQPG